MFSIHYLEWAVESILIPEQLVIVSDTVQPASIYQCLAYGYSLGSASQRGTGQENGEQRMDKTRQDKT